MRQIKQNTSENKRNKFTCTALHDYAHFSILCFFQPMSYLDQFQHQMSFSVVQFRSDYGSGFNRLTNFDYEYPTVMIILFKTNSKSQVK